MLVGAVGIELLRALNTCKLLILRNGKREKNCKNAEPRYTPGTRADSEIRSQESAQPFPTVREREPQNSQIDEITQARHSRNSSTLQPPAESKW